MYELTTENIIILVIMIIWVLPWKVYSLWTASKREDKWWFVALIILNTFGILEIFYTFFIAKKKWSNIKEAIKGVFSKKTN